jgi:hypothetical protein
MWETKYQCEVEMYPDALLSDHPSTWRTLCVVPVAKIPASMERVDKIEAAGPERHLQVNAVVNAGVWEVSVEPDDAYWEIISAPALGLAFLHDGVTVGCMRFKFIVQHESLLARWPAGVFFELTDITADLPEGW